MSTPNPEGVLLADVAVPAFFAKLASETGLSPPDAATADSLLATGNLITNAVGHYLRKKEAADAQQKAGSVKAATDAAFAAAGYAQPQQPTSRPGQYLEAPGVRDAALLMFQEAQQKQAAIMPVMTPAKTEEEDEEEKSPVVLPKK